MHAAWQGSRCRDGVDEQSLANNQRLGSSAAALCPAGASGSPVLTRWCELCRFYSRMQSHADMGHETCQVAIANLHDMSPSGKEISVVKKYVGKMPRSGRANSSKMLVSRFHSKSCVSNSSPGPAEYSPARALQSEAQSCYKHHGGYSFGKAVRAGLAKVNF